MKLNRVVVTGMGVLAPNAHGLENFEIALREGFSGIRYFEILKELNFICHVGGVPQNVDVLKQEYFTQESLIAMNSVMVFGAIAALDCWKDAGFKIETENCVDMDTGAIIGTTTAGIDTLSERAIPFTNSGKVRRLGSTMVEQVMASCSSANIAGLLGLGGQVTTNSSACATGTESIIQAFFHIKEGRSKRMLAGSTEGASHYTWAGFDAMKVLARDYNHAPERASRPMSESTSGFVPGAGAGVLMLENLECALKRDARIYAEVLGGYANCGGQRNGGSITAPNSQAVQHCIKKTIGMTGIHPEEIDSINGHLTGTMADTLEISNWQAALQCRPDQLPWINSTKSLVGHTLGAAGAIESIASILQLYKGFIHGSVNCEDLHSKLECFAGRIVRKTKNINTRILAKASFGFGDVNACVIFKRFED